MLSAIHHSDQEMLEGPSGSDVFDLSSSNKSRKPALGEAEREVEELGRNQAEAAPASVEIDPDLDFAESGK